MPSALRDHWSLDRSITFLNHGSFGACPTAVLEHQREWQRRMERQPVQFLARELPRLLEEVCGRLAGFVGCDPLDLVPVANATTGVNAVLWSLPLEPGDELLTTDHAYNACKNTLDAVAAARGALVVVASLPFPLASEEELIAPILAGVTDKTVLALVDHVTSPTGLVLPLERIVAALRERGVETLVDGAHAPGMLPLELEKLGAAFYTGNCHKWLSAPKGAAFLYVQRDLQRQIRPTTISHGASQPRAHELERFRHEFLWLGTTDPTAFLSVPAAIDTMAGLVEGGWPQVMAHNHDLACQARRLLLERWQIAPPCPESLLGSMAAIRLPDAPPDQRTSILQEDPWQKRLVEQHRIEVPLFSWPLPPRRCLRISAQLYNSLDDYERLGAALEALAAG